MARRSFLILAFALAFAVFIVMPPLLGWSFPPYPLLNWGNILDLFTPLVVIPLYWLLFREATGAQQGKIHIIAFILLAALWVEGQGMHLSANSIAGLLGTQSGTVRDLAHFYDEVLSHYLWHVAIMGLSVLLMLSARVSSTASDVRWALVAPSAILYGLTYFLAVNEGGTVPLGLPAAVLIPLWVIISKRQIVRTHDLVAFFTAGYGVAIILFLGWYVYWGGFPQFSEVGLL
ncbi:MAG: hypothetical protein ACLFVK_08490 [Dehalococcoidia bacterium]